MITVRVFVASPNDRAFLRDVVLQAVGELRRELDADDIAIVADDWRPVPGGVGEPQSCIDPEICRADILLMILGHRVGEGTRKELRLGRELHAQGQLQELMLYFEAMSSPMLAMLSAEARDVLALRESLAREMLYHEFTGADALRSLVRTHLVRWVAPLRSVHRFQRQYGKDLDPWLTQALNVPNSPANDGVVALEKIPWDQELPDGNDVYDYRRYLASRDGRPYDVDMLGCYRIARYLFRQVLSRDPLAFRDRPFTTFVHRFVADHVRRSHHQGCPFAGQYLSTIRGWLPARSTVFANARSFAAYQIGMCRDRLGRDELTKALNDASEDIDVRRYAALALGMTRTRAAIADLSDIHDGEETRPELRRAIGHAILAAAGLLPR